MLVGQLMPGATDRAAGSTDADRVEGKDAARLWRAEPPPVPHERGWLHAVSGASLSAKRTSRGGTAAVEAGSAVWGSAQSHIRRCQSSSLEGPPLLLLC